MPEGVGYGPQYTASTGLTLNYIGSHCYALSGAVPCNNNETTLLEFTTASNSYIVANAQVDYATTIVYTEDVGFQIYFNGTPIYRTALTSATGTTPTEEIELLIPPGTTVKITGINLTNTSNRDCAANIVGRIYGRVD